MYHGESLFEAAGLAVIFIIMYTYMPISHQYHLQPQPRAGLEELRKMLVELNSRVSITAIAAAVLGYNVHYSSTQFGRRIGKDFLRNSEIIYLDCEA